MSQATAVLKEFYRKAATATALVQTSSSDKPEKNPFQEAYTGMGGESTGVVGMLEVIGSDFARLESETEAAEEQAAKEYDYVYANFKLERIFLIYNVLPGVFLTVRTSVSENSTIFSAKWYLRKFENLVDIFPRTNLIADISEKVS